MKLGLKVKLMHWSYWLGIKKTEPRLEKYHMRMEWDLKH